MDSPGSPFNPIIPRGPAAPVKILIEMVKPYPALTESHSHTFSPLSPFSPSIP